jgi:hypothetical protein
VYNTQLEWAFHAGARDLEPIRRRDGVELVEELRQVLAGVRALIGADTAFLVDGDTKDRAAPIATPLDRHDIVAETREERAGGGGDSAFEGDGHEVVTPKKKEELAEMAAPLAERLWMRTC